MHSTKLDESGAWPPRFSKLTFELEGDRRVAYVDARRFGRIKLQVGAGLLAAAGGWELRCAGGCSEELRHGRNW